MHVCMHVMSGHVVHVLIHFQKTTPTLPECLDIRCLAGHITKSQEHLRRSPEVARCSDDPSPCGERRTAPSAPSATSATFGSVRCGGSSPRPLRFLSTSFTSPPLSPYSCSIYIYNLYSYLVNIGILIMSSLLLFLDYCVYPPSGALWMLISLRSICSSWMRSLGQEHGAPARKGVSRGR